MVHFRKAWLTVQIQPNYFNNIFNLYHQTTKRKYIVTIRFFVGKHYSLVTKLDFASMIFYISVGRWFYI